MTFRENTIITNRTHLENEIKVIEGKIKELESYTGCRDFGKTTALIQIAYLAGKKDALKELMEEKR